MVRKGRTGVFLAAMAMIFATTLAAAPGAGADEDRGGEAKRVRITDNCDPASFNAAFGPGTCSGLGTTKLPDFLAQLQATGAATGWAFRPASFHLDAGDSIKAVNKGGEFHTFSEVAAFGGGCVKPLNDILGLQPVPECTPTVVVGGQTIPAAFVSSGVNAGAKLNVKMLAPGTHKFECLIHPWMQSVVHVSADDDHHDD